MACPARVRALAQAGALGEQKRADYRESLNPVREIARRHARLVAAGERAMLEIARWILAQWEGENARFLQPQR